MELNVDASGEVFTATCPEGLAAAARLLDIQQRLPEAIARIEASVAAGEWPFLCDAAGGGRHVVGFTEAECGPLESWFLIGDIHGDFFALLTLLETARALKSDFRIAFLGDLVDRGEQHAECLVLLFEFAQTHPGRVLWLAGNHDIAFSRSGLAAAMHSAVEPSECLDYINDVSSNAAWRNVFGSLIAALPSRLPRAALFPDGLLLSHGGFPLTDRLDGLAGLDDAQKLAWLETPENLQDFTWTRLTRFPRKIPNRAHKGCQYGYRDFQAFREAMGISFPVQRLVVGHEHPADGWEQFDSYPAVVLSGFGFDYLLGAPEKFAHFKKRLVMGVARAGRLPLRIDVDYPSQELTDIYPQVSAGDLLNETSP